MPVTVTADPLVPMSPAGSTVTESLPLVTVVGATAGTARTGAAAGIDFWASAGSSDAALWAGAPRISAAVTSPAIDADSAGTV